MPVEVILPKVDMDMSHGTLSAWHVAEGELVRQGAALFDIETDKAAMEVESPATGYLHHVTAKEGDRIAVGAVIGWLYAEGEEVGPAPAAAAPAPAEEPAAKPAETVSAPAEIAAPVAQTDKIRATPAARKAAREGGIALASLTGSGPRGRIQGSDVAQALAVYRQPAASVAEWSPQPGPLAVSTRGGEGVPLVMIHGFTADSQSWMPLEKAMGRARPLIRIDLPGHGKSPRRRIASFADLARMLVEAFDDATRAHDQVHLLGHSLGGALALAIADIRARKLTSLSLIAPAGLGPEVDAEALTGIIRASRAESLAPWLRRLTASPDTITDDYARAAMATRRDPELRAAQADMAQSLFADSTQCFDLRPALARLETPAAILWGREDRILPARHALAAGSECAIHRVEGAGHIPQYECPEPVARILARHLAGAEATAG
ncbi:acetoin dehydrogenase dihydrolipoyllysine-residue acetyltransferase subunit [Pseudogemmobacter humi]|uniref:Dihydrolipoyllysine-residue acetyltransferase component of acetoin cleaving system n=1 Tax=Pseudogemmobacter humi TaxID=2483812 RepID=A0A3P5XWY7_9RHOB|nr:acetoin dehydrogenase dihydrolipoyllysine-residue acetyltransferase subunit [Pseudogemmobacter humi]VDC33636.1 Dihydrolipoyllysine-residue acetyltransferase component of acetoin cleaving system [Pseudogemmobacter humi]